MTDVPPAEPRRRHDLLGFLLFLLLPAALLGESLFTGDKYLLYDIAEFPPIAQTLTAEQLADVRSTANYDATEAPIWFAIELQLAREAFERRQLPHWNPWVRTGAPMLAHGHTGFMNPLHLPALLFPDPADGLLYLTYVMFALAGALMFGFLRAMKLGAGAAGFGALAFAWSGTMTANGHWYMRMEALAMLPGMLWAIVAVANRTGRARALPAAGLAVTSALCWLSGFPQYGIPVTLLAAGFGLVFVLRETRNSPLEALRLTGWLVGAGLLGVLLAMPQLLQMLEFYPQSNRPIDESIDRAARHALAPFGLLGYIMPEAFSHPGDASLPQDAAPLPYLWSNLVHWQTGDRLLPNYNFTEYTVFPGTMPLVLAALALLMPGPRWRWLVVGAFVGVWLLATGAFGVSNAYYLPGIRSVPPYRFAGPACALLAMLAAIGVEGVRKRFRPVLLRSVAVAIAIVGMTMIFVSMRGIPESTTPEDTWLVRIVERYREAYSRELDVPAAEITPATALAIKFSPNDRDEPGKKHDAIRLGRERLSRNLLRGGIALLLGGIALVAFSLRHYMDGLRGWPTVAMFGLAAIELGAFGFHLNRGQACEHQRDTAVHTFLRDRRDEEAKAGGFLVGRGVSNHGPYNLPGGTLAAEHIRDLNFYTFVDNKSDLPIRKLYGDAFILRGFVCDAVPDDERLERPYWDLMGLRYVLATQPMKHAGERVGPERVGDGEYRVYERPNAMPRAWVVPSLTVIDDEAELVDRLASADLDPRAGVLVSSADADRLGDAGTKDPSPIAREVTFPYEDSKRLTVRVGPGDAGYLVLADTFFPGWEATLDDEPVAIGRGNLYQRVLAVPATECTVQFHFRADGFLGGVAIGCVALLGWIVMLFTGVWPRRLEDEATDAEAAEDEATDAEAAEDEA